MTKALRILVHSDRPHFFLPAIDQTARDSEIKVCRDYAGLEAALEALRPDVVLSHKFEPRMYPAQTIIACSSVRWVHIGGTGVDHFAARDPSKLMLTNSPGVTAAGIAEYVLQSIYATNFNLKRYFLQQECKEWRQLPMRRAKGETITIVGVGLIGRAIGALARACGLRVVGVRKRGGHVENFDAIVQSTQLHEVLPTADYLVLAVPKDNSTQGLIGARELALLPNNAVLINVARGGVVDESALIDALSRKAIRGAVIDVFETEPLPRESALWTLDSVLITPHAAGFVEGWEKEVATLFADNLRDWMSGRPLRNLVS